MIKIRFNKGNITESYYIEGRIVEFYMNEEMESYYNVKNESEGLKEILNKNKAYEIDMIEIN